MPQPARPAAPAALSKNARTVLEKRYLVKDKTGAPTEQPEDLFWRVATVVAEADRRYGASEGAVQAVADEFYCADDAAPVRAQLADAHERRPSARPAVSACFVLPVEDALANGKNGIYDTLALDGAHPSERRRHRLLASRVCARKGSMVRSTTGVASGPDLLHEALRRVAPTR